MGEVYVILKVMPKSPEAFDDMKKALESLKPVKMEVEEIAFGLKAIMFYAVVPEESGADEELERRVDGIESVESVEVVSVSRGL